MHSQTTITCPHSLLLLEKKTKLDRDAVRFSSAANDCCFHIAKVQKTVPLQVIQDVQLQT